MSSVLKTMDEAKCEKRSLIREILDYQDKKKYTQEDLEKKTLKRLREICAEVNHIR
jgi:hypothetical protein